MKRGWKHKIDKVLEEFNDRDYLTNDIHTRLLEYGYINVPNTRMISQYLKCKSISVGTKVVGEKRYTVTIWRNKDDRNE